MELPVDVEAFRITDLGCNTFDLTKERFELLLPRLLVLLEVLNKLLVPLLLNERLEVLDVLVELRGPLLDRLDTRLEGLPLCHTPVMHQTATV